MIKLLATTNQTKKKMNIHIIGGGNLGVSVAIGIAKFHNHKVTVTRRNISKIQHLNH
jgi:pyrroline-5-carboxylate reductase